MNHEHGLRLDRLVLSSVVPHWGLAAAVTAAAVPANDEGSCTPLTTPGTAAAATALQRLPHYSVQ